MKPIRESLEPIEPRPGARERMLEHIYAKAQPKKKSTLRRLALPIAACVCLAAVGVAAVLYEPELKPELPPADSQSDAEPYARVASPAEFEVCGMALEMPVEADNAEYAILNGAIASVEFEVDGHTYYLRAARGDEDVSGFSPEEVQDLSPSGAQYRVMRFSVGHRVCHKLRWADGDAVYYLSNTDGASLERLMAVYELLRDAQI